MKKKPRKQIRQRALVVVAHPDDETLFFAGAILTLPYDFDILCVTDGNADGLGSLRQTEFQKACRMLKGKIHGNLNFPDQFGVALDIQELQAAIKTWSETHGSYKAVFTHSPVGEYGHRHHQDTCLATHLVFAPKTKVYSVAYNCVPDMDVLLSDKIYKIKTKILSEIYFGESKRLISFLPATSHEGFVLLKQTEVQALHSLIRTGAGDESKIKKYSWLLPFVREGHYDLKTRPF